MNEQLALLVELQEMDTRIIHDSKLIKTIPLRISEMDKPIAKAETSLEYQRTRFQNVAKKRREKELQVEENKARLEKLKGRTADIKDNKSYQAHLKEIETLERSTVKVDDEILDMLEGIERETVALKEAEAALAEQKRKAEELKKILDEEAAAAAKELKTMMARRTDFIKRIAPETYKTYRTIAQLHNGQAVVRADNEICSGCYMNIMPQLFMEVKKNTALIHCPQCRRILYFAPQSEGVEPPPAP